MLVEPLLPRAWRKELDEQKILKDDQDTDLYATSIGKKDMKQAAEEEGLALQDDFVALEAPKMAKLSLQVLKLSDALDLVPVSNRKTVEHATAHAVGQGLESVMQRCKAFEVKYATSKYHQAWLCALNEVISEDGSTEQVECGEQVLQAGTQRDVKNSCHQPVATPKQAVLMSQDHL